MRRIWFATALFVAACRQGDGPVTPGNASVFVSSDPPGARLIVDDRDTGLRTPDTLRGLGGRHDISAQMDTFGATYGFTARVFLANVDSVFTISGPLVNRCSEVLCYANQFRYYAVNRVRFASNPVGNFFFERGSGGDGLLWPSVTNNSYASGSMVGFAGVLGLDTVALGIYDNAYLAGRPAPELTQTQERIDLRQSTWIVPSTGSIMRPTARGLEVSEHLIATQAFEDLVLLRLVFRNITDRPLYGALDPTTPVAGRTYDQVYIGFLLDPDIGTPNDDALSYDKDQNLAFAYDARFEENDFGGGFNRAPGLIGLKMVEAPPGTTIVLNGWTSQGVGSADWFSGQISEKAGWAMLSGIRPYSPDHPDPQIGHLPLGPGDARLSVSAGPLRLAPGDSAAVTVAIVLADPAPGLFTPGTLVEPGDPTDKTRVLYGIAANLIARAAQARAALDAARH
jgi:hypothetical protein